MQRGPGRFGPVVTAMATPFDEEGRLDLDGVARLARHLAAHGSSALVVTGTTGESPTLSDAEKRDCWRAAAEAVTVPVIAGSTTADTAHSVELTRQAAAAGAAAILAVTPYYNRPPQAGLRAHFEAVAGATSLPVLLYDIPVRTGRKVSSETILALAREVPNIVGLKDAAGDVAATARLLAAAPDGFECYSGDDALTLPLLAVGAVGVVSVAGHWVGEELDELVRRFLAGDVEGARELNAALLPFVDFQSSEAAPNPLPAKAMLRALGLPAGQCRPPLGPAPPGLDAAAGALRAELEVLRGRRARPTAAARGGAAPARSPAGAGAGG